MPQKFSNAVVMIADGNYIPPALFVADRLSKQSRRNFDIIIMRLDEKSSEHLPQIPGVVIRDFTLDARAPQVSSRLDRSGATYGRLSLDKVLPPEYTRVLYLDADIWIGDREIADLFAIDLKGHAVAAVRDAAEVVRPNQPQVVDYRHRIGLTPQQPTFNAGVLLIDMAAFAERHIGEKALSYIANGGYVGELDDQSALNSVLAGDWLEISPLWNWQFGASAKLTSEFQPAIVHFIGRHKPWTDRRGRFTPKYREAMHSYLKTIGYPDYVAHVPWYIWVKHRLRQSAQTMLDAVGLGARRRAIRTFMSDFKQR